MQEELRALITRHCGTIAGKVASLSGVVTGITRGGAHAGEHIVTAVALAHEIRGSAGSIGFRDVFKAATSLEDALKSLSRSGGEPAEIVDLMNALADIALNLRPESSSLFDADLAGLARR